MKSIVVWLAGVVMLAGCSADPQTADPVRVANHSFGNVGDVAMTHLNLDLRLDFDRERIIGRAGIDVDNKTGADRLVLDIMSMRIDRVTLGDDNETPTRFAIGDSVAYLGRPLIIDITPQTQRVNVYYETLPGAAGLFWLDREQTRDKVAPFMFTQSQAILARSWVPCQDNPELRVTYEATVTVPPGMLALMSAENPQEPNESGVYQFTMPQSIPTYLLALSAGNIGFRAIGPHTGVYSEPSLVDAAQDEFIDTEAMLVKASELYGEYKWGRFDILVLPPSFPYGGMENPRVTFVTPILVAGDRSLVATIAHELAHSWSGNLVTASTWDDFWLNEGFTTYFERRIMELIYGTEIMEMQAVLGFQDLEADVEDLEPEETKLKLDSEGTDPDAGLGLIAYEKGYLLLRLIEETVGRDNFDSFLRTYFNRHEFTTMDTERFLAYLRTNLLDQHPGAAEKIDVDQWVYQPGIPSNHPTFATDKFEVVDAAVANWGDGAGAGELNTTGWRNEQWQHFIEHLPKGLTESQMRDLDNTFGFAKMNGEIQRSWFVCAVENNYQPAYPAIEAYLVEVGRRWLITPIYRALAATPEGKAFARQVYEKARPGYHVVTQNTIDGVLDW